MVANSSQSLAIGAFAKSTLQTLRTRNLMTHEKDDTRSDNLIAHYYFVLSLTCPSSTSSHSLLALLLFVQSQELLC
jgi:hypothetical protein